MTIPVRSSLRGYQVFIDKKRKEKVYRKNEKLEAN